MLPSFEFFCCETDRKNLLNNIFNTSNSELLYAVYFNRYKTSKMNNPLNRKDCIMSEAACMHSKRCSVYKSSKSKEK